MDFSCSTVFLAPYWVTVYPTELRCIPYGIAHPNWDTLHPTELHCTLLTYAAPCELRCTLIGLHTVPLCNFVKYRNAGLSGTRSARHRKEKMPMPYQVRSRNKDTSQSSSPKCYGTGGQMLNAGIPMPVAPMPVASASMPMPSFAN
jgi:hypothetical protein